VVVEGALARHLLRWGDHSTSALDKLRNIVMTAEMAPSQMMTSQALSRSDGNNDSVQAFLNLLGNAGAEDPSMDYEPDSFAFSFGEDDAGGYGQQSLSRGSNSFSMVSMSDVNGPLSLGAQGKRKAEAPSAGADDMDVHEEGDEEDLGSDDDPDLLEKRARNREHAKHSRMRKKVMLDALEARLMNLRRENLDLRLIVNRHMPPEKAEKVLKKCNEANAHLGEFERLIPMTPAGVPNALSLMDEGPGITSAVKKGQSNFFLMASTGNYPIVYASPGFLKMTGYASADVIGRECTFMQGPGTDPTSSEIFLNNLRCGADTNICILNYKQDGTAFWNHMFVQALRNTNQEVPNFMGVCVPVDTLPLGEFRRRLRKVPLPADLLIDDPSDDGPVAQLRGKSPPRSAGTRTRNQARDPLRRTRGAAAAGSH
jgi:PAS domain S-box-containing protein